MDRLRHPMTTSTHDGRHGSEGRWNGALTQRPLPEDAALDELSPAARAELAEHWLLRGASERRVADAFVVIREALRARDAEAPLLALAERAIDDELRHTEICRVVASKFAGAEQPSPALLVLSVPEHAGASPALRQSLHIVGHCALNETLASSVLEAALEVTTGTLAKAALRELLSDEVDHARIGWGYLSSLHARERAQLASWLPGLVRANLRMWRDASRLEPSDATLVQHGALSRELVERALRSGLRDLVLPGFEQLGVATLDVRAACQPVE